MSTNTSTQTQPDWEEIILRLTAFTHSWVKGKSWFRGKKTTTFLMGKEIEDYVFQAIGKFIANPEKFDSQKGELIEYLKYNLVRSFIANDVRRTENKLTDDIFDDNLDDDETSTYAEKIMPYTEALFPDDIDYDSIKRFIEAQIQGDKDVENIFLATYTYDMKRREVIKEFAMSPGEYDNGMRRLKNNPYAYQLAFLKKQTNGMSKTKNQDKVNFINLFLSTTENDSITKNAAKTFLLDEGINTEKLVSEGLKKIKRIQMLADASRTENEMEAAVSMKVEATAWVDNLLANINFSLPELVQKEELSMSFRNVENLSKDDIRNILIRHFTLKFMNKQNNNEK